LSAIGQLNAMGYLVMLGLVLLAGGWYWASNHPIGPVPIPSLAPLFWRWKCRFRRPLPGIFLVLATLAVVGGLLYAPNNGDALTYRIPRILHWVAEGRWHWIPGAGSRLNYSATGFEWLMLPLLLFTGTDRLFFLINVLSYLLLPGLIFSVFWRLGIRRRVAWQWMWLIPSGYGFVLQAGSTANDAFAAIYLLASLHFALRSQVTRRISDMWLAILAAGLLTGAKASNLPLLLPCVLAAIPALGLLRRRMVCTAAILLLTVLVSYLPVAILNHVHSGHWSGDPQNQERMRLRDPLAGLLGNFFQISVQNLAPPVFPYAKKCSSLLESAMPSALRERLGREFPRFSLAMGEMPIEEGAGLGCGVTLLFVASCCVTLLAGGRICGWGICPKLRLGSFIVGSGTLSLLFCMASLGSESAARLVIPYYPLLVALPLLSPIHDRVVRWRAWRIMAVLAAASAIPAAIAAPARPLWPAQTLLACLENRYPESPLLGRAQNVYAVYAARCNALASLLRPVSLNRPVIGVVCNGDHPETSLWRPFGSRQVIHLMRSDDRQTLQSRGIEWAVLSASGLRSQGYRSIDEWLRQFGGQLVQIQELTLKASLGPEPWFVVRIPPPG
jgi:hypothetical protein